jgi:nitroreductase
MENMWLMAASLGISVRILSDFGDKLVDVQVKKVLDIPDHMNVVYGLRLGYPVTETYEGLRIRRDLEDFTHHNGYGNKGFE